MHSETTKALHGDQTMTQPGPLLFRNISAAPARAVEAEIIAVPEAAPIDLPRVVEAAREEGRREAVVSLQGDLERRVQQERANVASALDSFVTEKRKYFAGLEKEVVRLALAIAERVLHRETAMDPTLLAGAARVVLEQVDQDSSATLLVPPSDLQQWQVATAALQRDVKLCEEPSLERGACLLQTEAGSFELGLRAQLCEIERGFFELLGRTPAMAP